MSKNNLFRTILINQLERKENKLQFLLEERRRLVYNIRYHNIVVRSVPKKYEAAVEELITEYL